MVFEVVDRMGKRPFLYLKLRNTDDSHTAQLR
jgi:hypothetical protein